MLFGHKDKTAYIDLSNHRATVGNPHESYYRKFTIGMALSMTARNQKLKLEPNPCDEQYMPIKVLQANKGVSPPRLPMVTANARPPVKRGFNISRTGGFWPVAVRRASFDGFLLAGKFFKSVNHNLYEMIVEIPDTPRFWGMPNNDSENTFCKSPGNTETNWLVDINDGLSICAKSTNKMGMFNLYKGLNMIEKMLHSKISTFYPTASQMEAE